MALRDAARQRRERKQLTRCPLCGADLSGKTKTADHFYTDHLPEDFGLTPLGEIRDDTETPLFEDEDEVEADTADKRVLADGGEGT